MRSDHANGDMLQDVWSTWTGVLDRYSAGTPWSEPLSPVDYSYLHNRLRVALQTACRHVQGESLEAIEEMDKLSEPWLTLEAVRSAEKHIVASVVEQSLQLQRQAFGTSRGTRRFATAGLGLAAVSTGVLVGPQLTGFASRSRVLDRGQDFWDRTTFALQNMDPSHWLAVCAAAVVVAGIVLLKSTRRY